MQGQVAMGIRGEDVGRRLQEETGCGQGAHPYGLVQRGVQAARGVGAVGIRVEGKEVPGGSYVALEARHMQAAFSGTKEYI